MVFYAVHHLFAEVDAEATHLALVGRKFHVRIGLFQRVEGYACIAQFDGQHQRLVVEARASLKPSNAAFVGVAHHVLDGLLDRKFNLEAQVEVVGHVGINAGKLEELFRKFGKKAKDIINKLVSENKLIDNDDFYEIIS